MPKDEWGVKRLCPHCASRFYDLRRDPMTCPECGHGFSADSLVAHRGRALIPEKVAVKAPKEDVDEIVVDPDLEEETADVDLDDDLLEDDDDDNVSLDEIADVSGNDDDT
jgi:uncharacterized protein (TIGR02300 family)